MNLWSPEMAEKLVVMWQNGHTARQIGDKLGVTRNAVISKVGRLGLRGLKREAMSAANQKPDRRCHDERVKNIIRIIRAKPPKSNLNLPELWDYPSPFPRDDMSLCPWPLWANGAPANSCCGAPRAVGPNGLHPYCRRHMKVAVR